MLEDATQPPPMSLFVGRKQSIADDIFLFELKRTDRQPLPAFTPGAHIEVEAPGELWRKYSLINAPDETDRYIIAVKREGQGRGGSQRMCDRVGAGERLDVRAPRNDFELVASPAGYTLIAGGIGITPLYAMARALKAEGKPFKLYYLTRSPSATAFLKDLSAPEWKANVVIHHDGGDSSKMYDLWPALEKPKGHVYCCGPRPLMDAVRDMTGHWSSSAVHFEAFTEAVSDPELPQRAFNVVIRSTGQVVAVPEGATILEALYKAAIKVPFSCQSGTCGSCRTGLVSGDVFHADLALTKEERATSIMICVSRARSGDIVLDL